MAFVQISENGPRSKQFGHPWIEWSTSKKMKEQHNEVATHSTVRIRGAEENQRNESNNETYK